MKRRDFLKQGLKAGIALNALPLMMGGMPLKGLGRSPLRSSLERTLGTNNKVLVIIQLQGGNDGLNTVIPYTDPNYKTLRPTLGLDLVADSLLPLANNSTLAFHGGMTGFSELYASNKMALLQNVGYPSPNLSHFRGTDIWHGATDSNIYASSGWVGRWLSDQNPSYPPPIIPKGSDPLAIQMGSSLYNLFLSDNGGMGIAINTLPTKENNTTHNFDTIPTNPTVPYQELDYVRTIQRETEVYSDTLAARSVQTNKVTYPQTTLGTTLANVAQCIASGMTTRVYLVTQGGYDTHSNQAVGQSGLLLDLSDTLLAFQQDIEALGVADQVAVMTYSEFGRRPQENGSGTDHGTAAPLFIIGTQVRSGIYGNDPRIDATTLKNGSPSGNMTYDPLHDFRNVYATVLNEWLMADSDQATRMAEIQNVLTSNNGTKYSNSNNWQSLGVFKAPQGAVPVYSDAPGLMLMQNYPNPVAGKTTIEYTLPKNTEVRLSLFSVRGVEVERIVDSRQSEGLHQQTFDGSRLPSGAYVYRLWTPDLEVSRQMIVAH